MTLTAAIVITYSAIGSLLAGLTNRWALRRAGQPLAPHGVVAIIILWPLFVLHFTWTVMTK